MFQIDQLMLLASIELIKADFLCQKEKIAIRG